MAARQEGAGIGILKAVSGHGWKSARTQKKLWIFLSSLQCTDMKGRTIVEISGSCIETIPVGTVFEVTFRGPEYSSCRGLGITSIWNDEYELIKEEA